MLCLSMDTVTNLFLVKIDRYLNCARVVHSDDDDNYQMADALNAMAIKKVHRGSKILLNSTGNLIATPDAMKQLLFKTMS